MEERRQRRRRGETRKVEERQKGSGWMNESRKKREEI